ncbi:hypothetical protein SCHPADRAFT_939516 [Schizopora paradoxa]|uniref:Uncharacterized protein n=1 Tax=Schizopora paradoxa TaxID=27342 RepID=A0A0H2RSA4_9AGAM|nr:hypothetical protein SCHPADRAFT_939516 [Schizopora paradoxa]
MAEFIQNLDPRNIIAIEAVLSFATSPFVAPSYNLPIFLFGVYAQESVESNQSLKLFSGLLGASILMDFIWLSRNTQNWFIKLLCILILILKLPTVMASLASLRQRGEQLSGLGIRGGDLSGPTVWSMPGGFSSQFGGGRGGYETVDDEPEPRPRPAAPQVHVSPPAAPPPPANAAPPPPAPGGYQAV